MRIWDLHCHLTGLPGLTPEERAAHLVRFADRMGIERMCVYMGLRFLADPTPEQLVQQNGEVLRAVAAFPDRLFGFVYASARHIDTSLAELERCVADGPMVGVKLWIAGRCKDPAIDPLISRAAELKALIFQHTWRKTTGNEPGESTPEDIVALSRRFPDLPLVCGHTGGNWRLGLQAIQDRKNLYADLAGSDPTAGFTEAAVAKLGAERVIYGSDAPGRSFASQLAKVHGAELPEAVKEQIFYANLQRLLTPILTRKGIKS